VVSVWPSLDVAVTFPGGALCLNGDGGGNRVRQRGASIAMRASNSSRSPMTWREFLCGFWLVLPVDVTRRIFRCSRSGTLRLGHPLHDVAGRLFGCAALSPRGRAWHDQNTGTKNSQEFGMHSNLL